MEKRWVWIGPLVFIALCVHIGVELTSLSEQKAVVTKKVSNKGTYGNG